MWCFLCTLLVYIICENPFSLIQFSNKSLLQVTTELYLVVTFLFCVPDIEAFKWYSCLLSSYFSPDYAVYYLYFLIFVPTYISEIFFSFSPFITIPPFRCKWTCYYSVGLKLGNILYLFLMIRTFSWTMLIYFKKLDQSIWFLFFHISEWISYFSALSLNTYIPFFNLQIPPIYVSWILLNAFYT